MGDLFSHGGKMPVQDSDTKPSWAEQVELGEDEALPPTVEDYDEDTGIKTLTEYKYNDDGKKMKVVRTYKVENRKVSKSIASRKGWKKFGAAASDPPGPNPANTIISEEIFIQFVHTKDQQMQGDNDEDPLSKIKGQKMVSCRICKGDHWTTRCPYMIPWHHYKKVLMTRRSQKMKPLRQLLPL